MDEMLVDNGDITLRVEVTGDGPVVLCVHGWPELASSWHHQVDHLSGRGYRVAAMDVRGYGGSSAPAEIERYTLRELAGDVAAVAAALDDEPIVLVGHDWGAPIVWNAAIRHPDRVRAVAGLSVPLHAAAPDVAPRPLRPALRRPVLLHAPLPDTGCRRGRVRDRHAGRVEARATSRSPATRRPTAWLPGRTA